MSVRGMRKWCPLYSRVAAVVNVHDASFSLLRSWWHKCIKSAGRESKAARAHELDASFWRVTVRLPREKPFHRA